jgi:hypothetical protein
VVIGQLVEQVEFQEQQIYPQLPVDQLQLVDFGQKLEVCTWKDKSA